MLPLILFLAVVATLAWRGTAPDERSRLLREGWRRLRGSGPLWGHLVLRGDPFVDGLRSRTRWLLATPALVAVKLVVCVLMLRHAGASGEADLLVSWGASVGPVTSNGEWWRLVTAIFVSWGVVHLLAEVAGLVQVASLLERLVGPRALATTFLAAGAISGAAGLATHPVTVQAGASGAIAGLYGLLLTLSAWGWACRSPVAIPLATLGRLWPGLTIFLIYTAIADVLWTETLPVGLAGGVGCGLVLATGLGLHKPLLRQVATAAVLAAVAVTALAVPVRGMADMAAEVEHVAGVEARTRRTYDAAVDRFRRGRLDTSDLRTLIEDELLPELESARERVAGIGYVPSEQQALVAGAAEYLRLREQSWRVRAEGLGQGDFATIREADGLAQAARLALQEITDAVGLVDDARQTVKRVRANRAC